MAMFIVKPWYRKKDDAIYGAEWAGTSDPSWVRTDAAVGFANPNPYYSGMSTTPSSPFDNIMPWSGMRRVTDANAGELVEIPKFYYKWTRDGVKMKLQISMSQFDGSHVSPAHADRGDGVGVRNYIYVGRYHCSSTNYKSATQVQSKANTNILTFRSQIHNLGSNVWQQDYALWWTIRMLYLVEYATWESQKIINYGCVFGGNYSYGNGNTDTMPYHTGTIAYSVGNPSFLQYRYIENLWSDMYEFVDGIYFNDRSIYITKNPADFGTSSAYVNIGTLVSTVGYIKAWTSPSVAGYEYALYPSDTYFNGDNDPAYVQDIVQSNTGVRYFQTSSSDQSPTRGLFYICALSTDSSTSIGYTSRLMVLPSQRIA